MGPKKQAKKGAKDEEEDTSTLDLLTLYKKYCKHAGIPHSKSLEKNINEKIDEGLDLPELLIDEKIGEDGAIELCRALKTTNKEEGYKHLQSIRVWEGNIGNQGLRAFYLYMVEKKNYKISTLEFINCLIGELGCEFISRMLNPTGSHNIKFLTLDYNNFGNKGMKQLCINMKFNVSLNFVSLNYCGITEEGVPYLKQIFENENSSIEKFSIQGNHIGNKGMAEFMNTLSDKEMIPLEDLNVSNTKIGNDEAFINSFIGMLNGNKTIHTINVKYNVISGDEFKKLIECLLAQKSKDDKHIYQIPIDEVYEQSDFKQYFDILKSRKKPKKKKPKKKK